VKPSVLSSCADITASLLPHFFENELTFMPE